MHGRSIYWSSTYWPPAFGRGVLALLLVMLAFSAGCKDSLRRQGGVQPLARAIAVVNNEKILYEDFQSEYQLFLTQWDSFIQNNPGKKLEIKELLLQRRIEEKLLAQEARRKGIEITDDELNAAMNHIFLSGEDGERSAESFIPSQSLESWRRDFKERLVFDKLIDREVVKKIHLSTTELRRYYTKHRDQFVQPERVKVRHIAVGSRSLFNRVMDQLERRGNFERLVLRYSITPDRLAGGDLGYVEKGILPEPFDNAIFSMTRIGSVTSRNNPVKTQMGYHIFRLEGRKSEGLDSYSKSLPEIKKRLLREKQEESYQRWLKHLKERSTIHIDNTLLALE